MAKATFLPILVVLCAAPATALAAHFELQHTFDVPEANQGVAVDGKFFYAVDNRTIAKYDKETGAFVKRWEGAADGPIIHLDSGMVMDGKLYAAHSNYSQSPMTSSVEVWDAGSLEHIETHSFGIHWGSLTWLDWHDDAWWAGFANYDRIFDGKVYGGKPNTTIVKFDENWQWQEAWTLPKVVLDRFADMSNSGGSWGPDGYLYLSGHDPAEVYKMKLPEAGAVLELVEILPLTIRGQGIAWDRSGAQHHGKGKKDEREALLYGIIRATRQVTVSRWVP